MATQTLIDQLNAELKRLGWNWQHPKIQTFTQEVAIRYQKAITNPLTAPDKVIIRLIQFVSYYYQCQHLMEILYIDWDDPQIQNTFKKYGLGDRLPMHGWKELVDALDMRWFESGGGF